MEIFETKFSGKKETKSYLVRNKDYGQFFKTFFSLIIVISMINSSIMQVKKYSETWFKMCKSNNAFLILK